MRTITSQPLLVGESINALEKKIIHPIKIMGNKTEQSTIQKTNALINDYLVNIKKKTFYLKGNSGIENSPALLGKN